MFAVTLFLDCYIDSFQKGKSFEEVNDNKPCKLNQYQRVVESYIDKEGKPVEYKRTARIDDTKQVKHLVILIKDGSWKYKKHRSYVDNCSNASPLMKMLTLENPLRLIFPKTVLYGRSSRFSVLIFQISSILFTLQSQSHLTSNIIIT